MAQQIIGIGAVADDGTGDPLRAAFNKANQNFTELYGDVAALGTLDTDGTMAANSDTHIPSQKAVRTYVASKIVGMWDLRGATDCSANPNYPAAVKGDAYVVTVAGKIGGASGTSVNAGDVYFATADNAGGTQASVGASWDTIVHTGVAAGGGLLAANNLSDVASAVAAKDNISKKGADIASAATTDLSTATGDFVNVTGTTTITALGTCAAGVERTVKFAGALTLTYNATSLILPTAANIATAAGDVARFRSLGSGNWLCVGYQKANGQALTSSGGSGGSPFEATPTIPLAANFSVVVGSSTLSDTSLGMKQAMLSLGSAQINFARYTGAFSANFTMTMRSKPLSFNGPAAYDCCLLLRNSTNNRYVVFGGFSASTQILVQNWSSDTTFSANVLAPTTYPIPMIPWRQIVVSGGNISFNVSVNGQDWINVATSTVAAFLTATGGGSLDQIGVGGMCTGSNAGPTIWQSFTVV